MKTITNAALLGSIALGAAACATPQQEPIRRGSSVQDGAITATAGVDSPVAAGESAQYLVGPYDQLQIFVWRAPELSTNVVVRPDGRISTPLVEDMLAAGKSPTELANDIETALSEYVKTPEVTVIVDTPVGEADQQVRIIGEVNQAAALPFRSGMTVLDVMLSVGGLSEFAAGNRTKLIRGQGTPNEQVYRLRLNDLMRRGDVSANVPVKPGDVIIVPESRF